ncbi:helix-turn-helix domain-containing protein [Amycolatopsis nigrescens]|uniref:helix-turn-helix domain-containing protein n=1 Tax=Amycolatopsis nigrescens TaxID=381445 RepID=UPI00036BF40D|nr:helix-turn-helix transcriptional regulator [Amycolatopsis nigrescens]
MDPVTELGRRAREIRSWRRLSLRAAAELSGISYSYLGQIERGERPVNSRRVLEALARTLRVSPTELTGKPYAPLDPASNAAHAAMTAVEDAISGWWVGEVPDSPRRPWSAVLADVDRLNKVLRPRAAYLEQAELLPRLIRDLLVSAAEPTTRDAALRGLIGAYKSVTYVAFDLGFRGLPALAMERMRQAAEELGDPVEIADVAWRRAQIISGGNRSRQYQLAVGIADDDEIPPHLRGMAHLTAALAAAAQGDADTAQGRLTEAAELAAHIDTDDKPWTKTDFNRTNVDVWRVSIGVELGHGAKVAEIAAAMRPLETLPVAHRQAQFWLDYGRGLLAERKHRERGLAALLKAEKLAPEKVRNNVFAREAVTDLLGWARRDAGGRELRYLAWQMGVAPIGLTSG